MVSHHISVPNAFLLRHQVWQHWLNWIVQNNWIPQLDHDAQSVAFLAMFCCARRKSGKMAPTKRHKRLKEWIKDMLQSFVTNSTLLYDLHCICMQSNQAFVVKVIQYFLKYLFRASGSGFNSGQMYAIYLRIGRILQDQEKHLADEKWMNLCLWLSCFDRIKSENGLFVAIPASIHQQLKNDRIRH